MQTELHRVLVQWFGTTANTWQNNYGKYKVAATQTNNSHFAPAPVKLTFCIYVGKSISYMFENNSAMWKRGIKFYWFHKLIICINEYKWITLEWKNTWIKYINEIKYWNKNNIN